MRLFIAIPLASETMDALEKVSLGLRSDGDGMRWNSRETWHITLQFLGTTSEEAYGCVAARLGNIGMPVFPVRIAGMGLFERAGVFFAGVDVSADMLELQRRVVAATSQCGFEEERPYHPHVTLARSRSRNGRNALLKLKWRVKGEAEIPVFLATEFLLVEAFLGSGGARYEIRERFPLGKG